MRRLLSPRHAISCSWFLWRRLTRALRSRGLRGRRESGAFLLGVRSEGAARITDFILYDDLDPNCLSSGIIHFDGRYFSELWAICAQRGLVVVADVHTHPMGASQSSSDRTHPMIAEKGHIALIIPNFASAPARRRELGIYRYSGARTWHTIPGSECASFVHLGL
jgi:proteasome lid subunit RPN8/RPN11